MFRKNFYGVSKDFGGPVRCRSLLGFKSHKTYEGRYKAYSQTNLGHCPKTRKRNLLMTKKLV